MNYRKTREEVLAELNTSSSGLSNHQRTENQKKYGINRLPEPEKDSLLKKFFNQLKDPLTLILIAAAIISLAADPHEWAESLIIVMVVVFNGILGVAQENSAEKSLEALKKLSSSKANVLKDGKRCSIDADQVSVGDILVVEAGDQIASDGRIIECWNLQVDESALTGESLPVNKHADVIDQKDVPLADQKNMVFAGTVCTYGRALVCVTSVGVHNEIGKIADMLLKTDSEQTPLQVKLAQISKMIGGLCLLICAVVFVLELMSGLTLLDAFKTSVALAVAAIPEGLATVVTICLALGVSQMAKQNAVVRKLPAVETLGCCSVICSDKTGTLTQNRMTVKEVYTPESKRCSFDSEGSEDIRKMMAYFTLCSDGELLEENSELKLLGDPTETALVYASWIMKDKKEDLMKKYPRLNEFAFDSNRKLMSVFVQEKDNVLQITKGAPDVILSRCVKEDAEAAKVNGEMAKDALRVLGVAIKRYQKMPEVIDSNLEHDLEFVGLAGMIDPPRPEVKDAIEKAKSGGIRTIMITGDHLITASAIAKNLGILQEHDLALTGSELSEMSEEELEQKLESISVIARVAPEQKVRIVNAWQKKGHVVAMTGDGVNDSPALKSADIGCAMGITGTDVAKQAAEMVLMDDNFATIISAVKQGRNIYDNIRKDVQFLLSSNIGEVLTIFCASVLNLFPGFQLGVPLLPIHLLWVNLITDSLPAFALGMERAEESIMQRSPRPKEESFFSHHLGWTIAWQGIMIGTLTLISYLIGNRVSYKVGMTMAFMTLAASQLVHAFNVKSEHSILNKTVFSNGYLWGSLVIGLSLQFLVIYFPPLSSLFSLTELSLSQMIVSISLALCTVGISEIVKCLSK
ncbi:MAG: calcium-translocating P-type ATPase, PMCA-type [Erysipelotrichaceae bacterium]|nr:calcium-translocating P-type ATPase, PMCA-type [Erysipelotrichaceae bacterium]